MLRRSENMRQPDPAGPYRKMRRNGGSVRPRLEFRGLRLLFLDRDHHDEAFGCRFCVSIRRFQADAELIRDVGDRPLANVHDASEVALRHDPAEEYARHVTLRTMASYSPPSDQPSAKR